MATQADFSTSAALDTSQVVAGAKAGSKAVRDFLKDVKIAIRGLEGLADDVDDEFEEASNSIDKAGKSTGDFTNKLLGAAAAFVTLDKGVDIIRGGVRDIASFESGLVGVGKTTDIQGEFLRELGVEIEALSDRIPVLTTDLLAIGQAAGQVGIRGSENILAFTETIARLQSATDIVGEEAARSLAQVLILTKEAPSEIATLGAVITDLGNKFATTESKIVKVTSEVAKATIMFGLSSAENAALAATLSSIGVEAELAGSVTNRAFIMIDKAIRGGGDSLQKLIDLTGMTRDELRAAFEEDAMSVFDAFIGGLNRLGEANGDVISTLEEMGLQGVRIDKVLPSLAERFDEFTRAQKAASAQVENANALIIESDRAFATLEGRLQLTENRLIAASKVIGASFAPSLEKGLDSVDRMVSENQELLVTFGELAGVSFEFLIKGLSFAADNVGILATAGGALAAIKLHSVITASTVSMANFNAVLAANPLGAVVVGVGIFAAALNSLVKNQIREYERSMDRLIGKNKEARESWEDFADAMASGQIETVSAQIDSTETSLEAWREKLDEVNERIEKQERLIKANAGTDAMMRADRAKAIKQLEKEKEARDLINSEISRNESEAARLRKRLAELETEQKKVSKTTGETTSAIGDQTDEIIGLSDALKQFQDRTAEMQMTAQFMTEFGLSAKEAGDAAKLHLAAGSTASREQIVEMVREATKAKEAIESITEAVNEAREAAKADIVLKFNVERTETTTQGGLGLRLQQPSGGIFAGTSQFDVGIDSLTGSMLSLEGQVEVNTAETEAARKAEEESKRAQELQTDATERLIGRLDGFASVAHSLGGIFQMAGGKFGDSLAGILDVGTGIADSVAGIKQAAASGSAAGVITGTVGIFAAAYDFALGEIEKDKAKVFSLPVEFGVSGGIASGMAIAPSEGALTQQQTEDIARGMRDAFDEFRLATGLLISDLPKIGVAVRADGEEFELTVAGVVHGVFSSFEDAFEEGLQIALGGATIVNAGERVATAIQRMLPSEDFLQILPVLRQLDDMAAGLSAGYSAARMAQDQFFTGLDLLGEKLLAAGVPMAEIVALRQREIDAQRQQLEMQGAAFAGISNSLRQFQAWTDSVQAFGDAQENEGQRLENLTATANRFDNATRTLDVGMSGAADGVISSSSNLTDGLERVGIQEERAADRAERFADRTGDAGQSLDDAGDSAIGAAEGTRSFTEAAEEGADVFYDAADGVNTVSDAFVEMIRESVRAQTIGDFFGEILSFQETYGFQVEDNQELQKMIAELEFRTAQIRIQLLVRELELNAQSLGLTEAQIAVWKQWAEEVAGFEFDFSKFRVPSGGAGGRRADAERERQRQEEEEKRAAEEAARTLEEFNRELERLELNASTVSGSLGDFSQRLQEISRIADEALEAGATTGQAARFQRLAFREEEQALLDPFRRDTGFTGQLSAADRQQEDARERARLLAEAEAERLGIPFQVVFDRLSQVIDNGTKRIKQQIIADLVGSFDLPLEDTRQATLGTVRNFRQLNKAFEAGEISARRYKDLVNQISDAQGQALVGDLLSAVDRFGAGTKETAEIAKKHHELERQLTIAQFELRIRLLEREGLLAAEFIEDAEVLLDAIRNASEEAKDEVDNLGSSMGSFASTASSAASSISGSTEDLAAAIRRFVQDFNKVGVGQFEAQAQTWINAIEDFERRIGEALGETVGTGTAAEFIALWARNLFGQVVTEADLPDFIAGLSEAQQQQLLDVLGSMGDAAAPAVDALEALIEGFDLVEVRATAADKILDQYAGTLEGTSELQRQVDAINDQFLDTVSALELLGASAEQLAEAEAIRQEQANAFWFEALSGVRSLREQIISGDLTGTLINRAGVEGLQDDFSDLINRVMSPEGMDLAALEQLAGSGSNLIEGLREFTGGAGPEFDRLLAEIVDQIESVEGLDPSILFGETQTAPEPNQITLDNFDLQFAEMQTQTSQQIAQLTAMESANGLLQDQLLEQRQMNAALVEVHSVLLEIRDNQQRSELTGE